MRFYLALDCDSCGNAIHYGPVLTLDEHRDLPVIDAGVAEHTRFTCDRCGTDNWTGDLAVIAETVDVEDDA